jgi:hypothetical protein
LCSCLQLVGQIANVGRKDPMGARMRNLLADYVRSVPGALEDAWSSTKNVDVARVREALSAELNLIQEQDENARKSEAERAVRRLNQEQLIWGGVPPQIVARDSA